MQNILHQLSKDNKFRAHGLPPEYWINLPSSPDTLNHLYELIRNEYQTRQQPIIYDGHWVQYLFNKTKLLSLNIEYIQLIRSCESFATSLFFYILFENHAARAAQRISNETYINYTKSKLKILNSSMTIEECLESYQCIKNSNFFATFEFDTLNYLNGQYHENGDQHYSHDTGAIYNLQNPNIFTVVGVLEYLDIYLEMLECVYPTLLHGINSLFQKENTHSRPTMTNKSHFGIQSFVTDLCNSTTNTYPHVHKEATRILLERYQYMKSHHSKCCRKSKISDDSVPDRNISKTHRRIVL